MNELISIVVPVYNVERYIRPCIQSLITQTYDKLQIIIVDDGSIDQSAEICDTFAQEDPRIEIIHQKNHGLSYARNVGLERCRGQYLMFVDSDDYIASDMVQKLYDLMLKYQADISMCNYKMIRNGRQDPEQIMYREDPVKIYEKNEALGELLIDKKIQNYAWGKLYRYKMFDGVRYPVGKKYEDVATTFQALEHCSRLVKTREQLYYYVMRSGSIVNTIDESNTLDYIGQRLIRYQYVKKQYPNLEQQNEFCYMISCAQAFAYAFTGDCEKLVHLELLKDVYHNFCKIYDLHAAKMEVWMNDKDRISLAICRKSLKEYKRFVIQNQNHPEWKISKGRSDLVAYFEKKMTQSYSTTHLQIS